VRRIFFVAGIALLCPGLYALGSAENEKTDDGYPSYTAAITGTLRLVGSDPFSRLVLSADDGKNYIIDEASPERGTLRSHQGRRIRMEGRVHEYPVSAGKKFLGVEYFITPARYDFPRGEGQ
jgi:hypothetical protein